MEETLECQEDELVALSSIYDERVFVRLPNGGEVNIYLDIPENFEVKICTSNKIETKADASRETSNDNDAVCDVFSVKYLPPLVLTFTYPTTYPSTNPPQYKLACKWLNVLQVCMKCQDFCSLSENLKFAS